MIPRGAKMNLWWNTIRYFVLLFCFLLIHQAVHSFSFSTIQQTSFVQPTTALQSSKIHNDNTATATTAGGGGWSQSIGDSALKQVESLASRIAAASAEEEPAPLLSSQLKHSDSTTIQQEVSLSPTAKISSTSSDMPPNERVVWKALANLERDMQMLDTLAGQKPQLSPLELTLLSLSVVAAGSGPLVGGEVTNFLAPASAAFCACIGIGAEYVGKVAVADGKEVAAATIQCAAEAEGFLANSERSKAIIPLCVGIGATCASFALLVPVLLDSLGLVDRTVPMVTELYLCCPLISVLAAAVASLAFQECKLYAQRATSVGNRRFAKSGLVGRTWLSTTEQMESNSKGTFEKWKSFSLSVLPAPIVGAFIPGTLPTKTIVAAALGAVQSAYFLTRAEHTLARATDAVALKSRSAAVCDTYANQGARSAAVLPFTSALSGLCAAATAAIVELPITKHAVAAAGAGVGGIVGVSSQVALVSIFPALAALFAAAASVSKARCQVDAEAATQAASTLALEFQDTSADDPVLRPLNGVLELIQLTTANSIMEPLKKRAKKLRQLRPWRVPAHVFQWFVRTLKRPFSTSDSSSSTKSDINESSQQQQQLVPALVST